MHLEVKVVALSVLVLWLRTFVYSVNEGDIGISYTLGSLTNNTKPSGMHIKFPWPFTKTSYVNVRPQTDQIFKVACGTADGLNLVFENVDVGNTLLPQHVIRTIRKYGEDYDTYLVKDKIRHQTSTICALMNAHEVFNTRFDEIDDLLQAFLIKVNEDLDSGLLIDFVRLSKPVIPEGIRKNYERLAEEKTILKVEAEKQERLKKEAETRQILQQKDSELKLQQSQMESQIEYEKSQNVNKILLQKMISDEEQNEVSNRIKKATSKTSADMTKLALQAEAEGLSSLYNVSGYREFVITKELGKAMASNSKFFFGDVPKFLPVSLFQTEAL